MANHLYRGAFPIYRPIYKAFKTISDRAERRLLAKELGPGSIAVDAGANIGIYSQFLATCVGAEGVVHSFEPSPDNFLRLRGALAKLPNVRLNQLALSDKTETSLLYISQHLNVDHRVYPTEGEPRKAVSIRATTLDDYFKPGEHVDLIKMDIQGYELHALRGAERVLTENDEIKLLLEFWPYGLSRAGTSGEALIKFLRQKGFECFNLHDGLSKPLEDLTTNPDDQSAYFNLFARCRSQR
jgi:FkbM family methyltransferase